MSGKKVFVRSFGGLVAALAGVFALTTSPTAASAASATEAVVESAPSIAGAGGGPIKNLGTGYCLDANYEGRVYSHPCNGGKFQQWATVDTAGARKFVNIATAQCLTTSGNGTNITRATVSTSFCTWGEAGTRQRWSPTPGGRLLPYNSFGYGLESTYDRGITLRPYQGSDSQHWLLG